MEICDNPSCKVWLHEDCLIDEILTKTYERLVRPTSEAESGTNGVAKTSGKKGKGKSKIWKGIFNAVLNADDGHTTVTISDTRSIPPKKWTERVSCLKCGKELD